MRSREVRGPRGSVDGRALSLLDVRKGHGAAFATYATIEKANVRFLSGLDSLTTYNSSSTILRKFCSTCGSNVEWSGHAKYPDWLSIPLALFDTPFVPASIEQYFEGSRVPWCKLFS